jgi:glutaredoxin-related protein
MQAVEINNETLVSVTIEPAGVNKVLYNGLIYDVNIINGKENSIFTVLTSEYHLLPDHRYALLHLRVSNDFSIVLPESHLELGTYKMCSEQHIDSKIVTYTEETTYSIMDQRIFRNFRTLIDNDSVLHRFLSRIPDIGYSWVNINSTKLIFPQLGHGDSQLSLGHGYSMLLDVGPMHNAFIRSVFHSEDYQNEYLNHPVRKESFINIYYSSEIIESKLPKVECLNGIISVEIPNEFCEGCQTFLDSIKVIKSHLNEIKIYVRPIEPVIDLETFKPEESNCCGGGSCGTGGCGTDIINDSEQLTSGSCGTGGNKSCACGGTSCNTPGPCESSECCKKKPEPFESIPVYQENVYVLFMKGTPAEPKCKYSRQMVELLNQNGINYDSVNLNDHPELKPLLKEHFPTFPQLWYNNKFLINLSRLVEQDGKL